MLRSTGFFGGRISHCRVFQLRRYCCSDCAIKERNRGCYGGTLRPLHGSGRIKGFCLLAHPQLVCFSCSICMQCVRAKIPCPNLYGNRIRRVAPFRSASRKPSNDPALIHRCLPDELLFEVFCRMSPYSLGRAECVCRKWRDTIRNPVLWRSACLKTWQRFGATNYEIVQSEYEGSWRNMWIHRPRIRHDGLYVSRNTYTRTGVAEWKVCYFRYLKFSLNGELLYKISPQNVKEVAKIMISSSKADCVFKGAYKISGEQIKAVLQYPGSCRTVLRMRLWIRGTTIGANNRLDILSLVTTGLNESEISDDADDILLVVEEWQEDETHDPDVPAISYMRGLSTFVFFPFEEVERQC